MSSRSVRRRRERRPSPPQVTTGRLLWPSATLIGWSVVLTIAAAILERLWFPRAWSEAAAPASIFYYGDTRAFLDFAAHLVEGVSFDNGVPFHPPGWPLVLACYFKLMGFSPLAGEPADPMAVKYLVACLSGVTVGLTVLLTARLAGRGAMLAAALLGTFHFGHLVQGTVPNSEALYGLLLVGALLVTLRWLHAEGAGAAWLGAAAGAISGYATLVRAEFLLCALLLAVIRWRSVSRRRGANAAIAAFVVGYVVLLTPSTVWHWRSISAFNHARADKLPGPLPRFAPVTGYGAFNFANANHERATGGFNFDLPALAPRTAGEEVEFDRAELDLANPAMHEVYVHGYRIGLRWLTAHPADALVLLWRKAGITSGAFAHGYLQTNLFAGVDGTRRPVDELDPVRRWLWPIHVALALAGAYMLWRVPQALRPTGIRDLGIKGEFDRPTVDSRVALWLLSAPLVTLAASTLLFFGYVRLGVAYLPVVWVLQAAALAELAGRIPWAASVRRLAPTLVLLIALGLLLKEARGGDSPHVVEFEGSAAADGSLNQDETVVIRGIR